MRTTLESICNTQIRSSLAPTNEENVIILFEYTNQEYFRPNIIISWNTSFSKVSSAVVFERKLIGELMF